MVVKTELAEGSGNTLDASLVKKKSRKGKEVSTGDAVAEVDAVDKKEKKKRKKAAKDEAEEGDKSLGDIDQEKPKKRSKRREEAANEDLESQVAEEDVKKHKKKRKHRDETANDHTGIEATEEDAKSHKKKRKHSDPEGDSAEPDEDSNSVNFKESSKKHKKLKKDDKPLEESDKPKKEKKKRRKHSEHGFKDPSSDESLSEQANKALSYAYAQVDTPSTWKFNKARQNWLIRNVLSEEAIPDDYVPLVNRYLSGVQGGAREALVKSCQAVIASQSEADDANPPSQVDGSEEKPTAASKVSFADTAKEQRARDLVQLLTQNVTEFE